jgi:ABC-type glycerol-3-phosphate transport system substrate-binding protein
MKINFQLIILIFFIAAAIVGVLVFSGAIPIGGSSNGAGAQGTVVLWGTIPIEEISAPLDTFNKANPSFVVKYEQKSADTFDQDLLEALAEGKGPDIFFLPDNLAYHYSNKIFTIPYASFSLAAFNETFAGAGDVFLTDQGILAFPMTIDPLMMYYNRSMLDSGGIVYPPATWDDLTNMAPILTQKDNSGTITTSAVALGQYSNIASAKDILATLFMQAGNPIIQNVSGTFNSTLGSQVGSGDPSSVLKFYTSFADPSQPNYSWNASFPSSDNAFSNENLAIYFGFASELQSLINKNPNQDIAVAPMPQIKNSSFKLTGARVTGLAISSFSKNFNTAFTAANLLSTGDFASAVAAATGTVPARKSLLVSARPTDAFTPYFYSSALFARSWLDPSTSDTDNIFSGMVNTVLSGNMSAGDAIKDANSKMSLLLLN